MPCSNAVLSNINAVFSLALLRDMDIIFRVLCRTTRGFSAIVRWQVVHELGCPSAPSCGQLCSFLAFFDNHAFERNHVARTLVCIFM